MHLPATPRPICNSAHTLPSCPATLTHTPCQAWQQAKAGLARSSHCSPMPPCPFPQARHRALPRLAVGAGGLAGPRLLQVRLYHPQPQLWRRPDWPGATFGYATASLFLAGTTKACSAPQPPHAHTGTRGSHLSSSPVHAHPLPCSQTHNCAAAPCCRPWRHARWPPQCPQPMRRRCLATQPSRPTTVRPGVASVDGRSVAAAAVGTARGRLATQPSCPTTVGGGQCDCGNPTAADWGGNTRPSPPQLPAAAAGCRLQLPTCSCMPLAVLPHLQSQPSCSPCHTFSPDCSAPWCRQVLWHPQRH